jgi:hypothetical protein
MEKHFSTLTRRSAIERLAVSFDEEEAATLRSLDRAAGERASVLGVVRQEASSTPEEREAQRLVPARISGQELATFQVVARTLEARKDAGIGRVVEAFDAVTDRLRTGGVGELRLMGVRDAPAYYADGRRTIFDIAEAFGAEYGAVGAGELTEYFRAYERAGVMTIK